MQTSNCVLHKTRSAALSSSLFLKKRKEKEFLIKGRTIHKKGQVIIIVTIIPLFTLDSIYSTNASGAGQMPETNNLNQT